MARLTQEHRLTDVCIDVLEVFISEFFFEKLNIFYIPALARCASGLSSTAPIDVLLMVRRKNRCAKNQLLENAINLNAMCISHFCTLLPDLVCDTAIDLRKDGGP